MRVLVVENDPAAASAVDQLLRREDYEVDRATTAASALDVCFAALRPDLLLLSQDLPDMAGTELCRQIRQTPSLADLPMVILSRDSEEIDRVVAFELGADDYITLPFDERELILRVKAILRRCYPDAPTGRELRAGPLRLDRDSHRVWLHAQPLALTQIEFRLLEILMSRRGRGQPRERLLQDVWGWSEDQSARTVDTHIRRLREKLGGAAGYIRTIRGVGYCFGDERSSNE
jgi:two-component system phosphate regulon response regulator PhoB